jgi:HEAT repeat protein
VGKPIDADQEPEVLTLGSQGWGAHYVVWQPDEHVFIHGMGCGPSNDRHETSRPASEDWSVFWRILDNLGVWDWGGNHAREFVCDGGDWFLTVRHRGRSLEAQGMYHDKLPHFFDAFERSLDALAKRLRWTPSCLRHDPPSVERLTDLFSLSEAVHALRMGTDRLAAIVAENIEGLGNGGQTLCDILVEMGPARMAVLPALIKCLDGDTDRTYWNVLALGIYGPDAAAALPSLARLLESTRDGNLAHAVRDSILAIDAGVTHLRAQIPGFLTGQNYLLRSQALRFVAETGARDEETLDALVDLFSDADADVSASIEPAVAKIGEDPERLFAFLCRPIGSSTVLITGLSHSSSSIQRITLSWLGMVGQLARDELWRVVPFLEGPELSVRKAAILAFSQVATTEEVVGLMKELLDDPQKDVRSLAMDKLGAIGAPARTAVPRLVAVIERADQYEYLTAIAALEKIAGRDRAIVEECLRLLDSDRAATRATALRAIERFQDNASETVRLAVASLNDANDEVREAAVVCLGKCGGAAPYLAVPALCDALDDEKTCASAANALSSLREAAVDAIPALVRALTTHSNEEYMSTGWFCAARALYTLSREHAQDFPPELVDQITRIGHQRPIWQ